MIRPHTTRWLKKESLNTLKTWKMSEMTYLQRRLAMKNGVLKSADGKKGSSDDQGTPNSADEPKSGPTPAKGGKPGKGQKKARKPIGKRSKKQKGTLKDLKVTYGTYLQKNPICVIQSPV